MEGRVLLKETTVVSSFAYRVPRIELELPVEFSHGESAVAGRTRNISDTGLLVFMEQLLLPGTLGVIRLRLGNCSLELGARVTHAELLEAGLQFHFASEQESQFVRHLVKAISKTVHRF